MAKSTKIETQDEPEENAEPEKKKGIGGLIIPGVIAIVAAGGAAAAAYFFAPAGGEEAKADMAHMAADGAKSHNSHNGHGGGAKAGNAEFDGGKLEVKDNAAYFILDPLIVSIRPLGDARHLRISLVIETSAFEAEPLLGRVFHMRDVLNTYLRSVDEKEFEDPAAMMRLRAQIRRRIEAVAPDVTVYNVLITEFILT